MGIKTSIGSKGVKSRKVSGESKLSIDVQVSKTITSSATPSLMGNLIVGVRSTGDGISSASFGENSSGGIFGHAYAAAGGKAYIQNSDEYAHVYVPTLVAGNALCFGTGSAVVRGEKNGVTIGTAFSSLYGSDAELESHGYGSFAGGYAWSRYTDCHIHSTGFGAFCWVVGYGSDDGAAFAYAGAQASVTFGYAASSGTISNFGPTSLVVGAAIGLVGGGLDSGLTGSLVAGSGAVSSLVVGRAEASAGASARIEVQDDGSLVMGEARGGLIRGTGRGCIAQGFVNTDNQSILASANGAAAQGEASPYSILASGSGSLARGVADTQNIIASGSNSIQFGPGTNGLADSLKVGLTLRLKGTVGAPSTPENGDIWVDSSGNVMIRSGGINKNISNIT